MTLDRKTPPSVRRSSWLALQGLAWGWAARVPSGEDAVEGVVCGRGLGPWHISPPAPCL